MNIYPNEYQNLKLNRSEKMFIRYTESCSNDGYLFLGTNPSLEEGQIAHILAIKKGVIVLSFFDGMDGESFNMSIAALYEHVYKGCYETIKKRMTSNKAIVDAGGKLKICFNYCYVFPELSELSINIGAMSDNIKYFIKKSCIFKETFVRFKADYYNVANTLLDDDTVSSNPISIDGDTINSVIQRLAPEYTVMRDGIVADEETYRGADNDLLIVTEEDDVIKAFRLDNEQINIVNKISKGEQLILACAGSGKSVLLISKCFKAAQMNPKKRFLITCKSRKLQELYSLFIDRAGLKNRNVDCETFHSVCRELLEKNGLSVPSDYDEQIKSAIREFQKGNIKKRYYGIFVDEIQEFEQDWYKLAYNLLENKNSDDHLFVICGDKTQKITKAQKRGQAPWNCGEGYPNYRGGNKSIRIEKNYRNCIEINDFINKYAIKAREILLKIHDGGDIDPDMFLRGKAVRHGIGTIFKMIKNKTSDGEAEEVLKCVMEAHDVHGIPYDEIAIIMYNKKYQGKIKGWDEDAYNLRERLIRKFLAKNIDYFDLYENTDFSIGEGVTLVSFQSSLGLDYRAVIVCGFAPFGHYTRTKYYKESDIPKIMNEQLLDEIKKEINLIYVACTRARDVLYIVQPETESLYMKMLYSAYKE